MSGKYIDLTNQIRREIGGNLAPTVNVLRWLDEHPDQVPGRTITESEFSWRTSLCSELEAHWFKVGFLSAGGIIVPDPEPSNAEKIKDVLMKADREGVTRSPDSHGYDGLAEWLDKAGVRVVDTDE